MGIYVNQTGFYNKAVKHATASGVTAAVLKNEAGKVIKEFCGLSLTKDAMSDEDVAILDFSDVTESGKYYFEANGEKSASFTIGDKVYDSLFFDSMKMFYFQRCGIALEPKFAGKYTHKACHTADVSVLRNESVKFECNGGWHDAGDFGRYVTAGCVALGHLLYAYELNPDKFKVELNIPETGNGVPDILNECRYEIEWLLKMQLQDGSVYHKCTSIRHTGFVMPEDDPLPFIVTPVSSMAVGDFAAVCAMAERIYRPFDAEFADKVKAAAIKAYDWLEANPAFLFENPKECTTGGYDDMCDADERMWACAEMLRMTGRESCKGAMGRFLEMQISMTALGWGEVAGFAALSVLTAPEGTFAPEVVNELKGLWIDEAKQLVAVTKENNFELAFRPYNFKWGSNMNVLMNADKLMVAYRLTGDEQFYVAATMQVDYILGRNACDTSYVTGHGDRAFNHPHNRPTESDGIDEAIPGYVSGGPNGHPCDEAAIKLIPAGTAPMKCYVDDWGSYSTNEITIYWNSPLVFALGFMV